MKGGTEEKNRAGFDGGLRSPAFITDVRLIINY